MGKLPLVVHSQFQLNSWSNQQNLLENTGFACIHTYVRQSMNKNTVWRDSKTTCNAIIDWGWAGGCRLAHGIHLTADEISLLGEAGTESPIVLRPMLVLLLVYVR